MFRQSKVLLVLVVVFISVAFVGCGAKEDSSEVKIEFGVVDEEYSGKTVPGLPRELKLTEKEQQEGFEKFQIYTNVKVPVESKNEAPKNDDSQEDSGGEQVAKPQI